MREIMNYSDSLDIYSNALWPLKDLKNALKDSVCI
jgi:hypothetical protein